MIYGKWQKSVFLYARIKKYGGKLMWRINYTFAIKLVLRVLLGLVFFLLYALWVVYRLLITKDIRNHKNELYFYTFLVVVWLLIYYCFFFAEINHFFRAA